MQLKLGTTLMLVASLAFTVAAPSAALAEEAEAGCGTIYEWMDDDLFFDDWVHGANTAIPSGGDIVGEGEWSMQHTWSGRDNAHHTFTAGRMSGHGTLHDLCGA